MRAVVIAVLVIGCGKGKEQRVCEHGAKLCDDADELSSCSAKLKDLKDVMGDSYGNSLDCALDANSCPEFVGCFIGGIGAGIEAFGKQFEHGVDKVMKKHDGSKSERHRSRDRDDDRAGGVLDDCKTFATGDRSARWDGCADHVRRELACEKFIDDLKCDCREDGVETWSFHASDPPLDSREAATRVAKANCKMGFGN
jgi:hypothetical protein